MSRSRKEVEEEQISVQDREKGLEKIRNRFEEARRHEWPNEIKNRYLSENERVKKDRLEQVLSSYLTHTHPAFSSNNQKAKSVSAKIVKNFLKFNGSKLDKELSILAEKYHDEKLSELIAEEYKRYHG